MRESYLFEYIPCSSPIGRLNPLLKTGALIAVCVSAALIPPPFVFLLPPVFIPLFLISGKAAAGLPGMWKLYIFFGISGVVKAVTGSVMEGAALSSGLLVMLFAGLIFYSTTKLSDFKKAVGKILRPVPLINEDRIAELISMTMAFLPLIFKTAGELKEAKYSRGFRPGKNPMRTLKLTSIPLLINLLIKSDEMADAYYSRGYGCNQKKTITLKRGKIEDDQ
ncbi:MAG: energy-coupling factor transporter transmembrane protein EcfT [Spirochaetales bacterium]|nr:energy-coupling factor transporter transmembrane protein EcfT [Spirochaetales bacterium]